MYSDLMTAPMRQELTRLGIVETRTPAEVDSALQQPGTTLVVVNSVCGCAGGIARPGVAAALQHSPRPDRAITVFAGGDLAATDRARAHFAPYPPSSPAIGLMRDGKLVFLLERRNIEGRSAAHIAADLTAAFDQFCAAAVR